MEFIDKKQNKTKQKRIYTCPPSSFYACLNSSRLPFDWFKTIFFFKVALNFPNDI